MGKKIFIVLGFIAAIIAVILSVTSLSNLAVTPIIIAFVCGIIVLYLSNKQKAKTKTIQYIFLLVIISLGLTIYKGIVQTTDIGDTEQLEQPGKENIEDSKEVLESIENE